MMGTGVTTPQGWQLPNQRHCLPQLTFPGSRSRSKTAQDLNGLSGFPARFELFERFEQIGQFFQALQNAQKPLISCGEFWTVFNARFEQFMSGLKKSIETIKRTGKGNMTLPGSRLRFSRRVKTSKSFLIKDRFQMAWLTILWVMIISTL